MLGGIVALHEQALGALKLPNMQWQFTDQGEKLDLLLRSDQSPQVVRAWVTTSASRDFREVRWHSFPMQKIAVGSLGADDKHGSSASETGQSYAFRYFLPPPHEGFAALFGEAVYPNGGFPYCLSTNVRIVGQGVIRH